MDREETTIGDQNVTPEKNPSEFYWNVKIE
jgi:hypothetical protein